MTADIRTRAIELIRDLGESAFFHAATEADDALEAGDIDRHRQWLSILNWITALERIDPEGRVQ